MSSWKNTAAEFALAGSRGLLGGAPAFLELFPARHVVKLKYRKDIDGLRCIAVLAVIVFHVEESWLSGGFLGVDIFFVISGFLITSLLLRERDEGDGISLTRFYKRRIQRLLPVLLVVHLAVLAAGVFLLMPDDLRALIQSYLWSHASLANVYFYLQSDLDYFSLSSQAVPLLHLWSLGVEEQFYLIWPLLLGLPFVSKGRRTLALISLVTVGSLLIAQGAVTHDRMFAHYMLPCRAWQLASGALCVFLVPRAAQWTRTRTEVVSVLGLAAVCGSFLALSSESGIPGLAALPAVVGTGAMLLTGGSSIARNLLSARPLVWIGVLSYSAYLWHWPIVSFCRYLYVDTSAYLGLPVILGSLALAQLSYSVVEQPFRRAELGLGAVVRNYVVAPYAVMAWSCGLILYGLGGPTWSLNPKGQYAAIEETIKAAYEYNYNCQSSRFDESILEQERCFFPDGASDVDAILVGDSNGAHFVGLFRELFGSTELSFQNVTQSSCPLVFARSVPDEVDGRYMEGCVAYNKAMDTYLEGFDFVIIGLSWDTHDRIPEMREAFEDTLDLLAQRNGNVVLLGKIPRMRNYDHMCVKRSVKASFLDCEKHFTSELREMPSNEFLRSLAGARRNVHYISFEEQLCPDGRCTPYRNGQSMYFDAGHLSMSGSHVLGKEVAGDPDVLAVFGIYEPSVRVDRSDAAIIFTVEPPSERHAVAFYLYRDEEKIDTRWYSSEFSYELPLDSPPGRYRVRYFVTKADEPDKGGEDVWKARGYSEFVEIP